MATKAAVMKTPKLNIYVWEGTNKRGEKVSGETNASTLALAKADIRRQGMLAKKVKLKRKPFFGGRKKSISAADVCVFSRQMATMMSAGIPLVQSFDIVGRGHTNPSMQELVGKIKASVESGITFSEALASGVTRQQD